MAEQDEAKQESVAGQPEPGASGGTVLACAATLATFFGILSASWSDPCLACGAGILAPILVSTADFLLMMKPWYSRRLILGRCVLLGLTWFVALGAGEWTSTGNASDAFEMVFSTPPPVGVNNVRGERKYAGLFDPNNIQLRFVIDERTLDRLVTQRGLVRDNTIVEAYRMGLVSWAHFRRKVSGSQDGQIGHLVPVKPMENPVVYRTPDAATTQSSTVDTIIILWDASTLEAYVHRY